MSGTSEEYSAYSDASHEYYQSRGQKYNLRPRRRNAPIPSAKTPKKLSREIYDKNMTSTFPSPGRIVTLIGTREAGNKTLHKIAVRPYKQPFGVKNLKKRDLITDHFWDGN